LIFQYRATDDLGYIWGYILAGNPRNIVYQKKIGIDIQVRNSAPFSFDLVATGSYKQATLAGYGLGATRTQTGQLGDSGGA
jgi:hypothetical protein